MNSMRPDISDRYEIISSLGEGGMGEVYLARDLELDRKVAVKVIRREIVSDEQIVTRTIREGKILSGLRHHGIAAVYEMNMEGPVPYIVQEYITGKDLGSYIKKGRKLESSEAWRLFEEQADVLAYIHGKEILHRDIKPENIMINESGQSILMDFGLALSSEYTRMTRDGNFVGTLKYCSPESILGSGNNGAFTDVYQLATVVYESMTHMNVIGDYKNTKHFMNVLFSREWEKAPLSPLVPEKLSYLIQKCCQFEGEKRPPDGESLKKLIKHLQDRGIPSSEKEYIDVTGLNNPKKAVLVTKNKSSLLKSKKLNGQRSRRTNSKTINESPADELTRFKSFQNMRKIIGFVFLLLAAATYTLTPSLFKSNESRIPVETSTGILEQAKVCLLFRDGFCIVLPYEAGKGTVWHLKSDSLLKGSAKELTGSFSRIPGGWRALLKNLDCSPGTQATLTIRNHELALGEKVFTLGEDIMISPLKVRYSPDFLRARWKINGFSPSKILVETSHHSSTGSKLKTASGFTDLPSKRKEFISIDLEGDTCTIPIDSIDPKDDIYVTLHIPSLSNLNVKDTTTEELKSSIVGESQGTKSLVRRYPPAEENFGQRDMLVSVGLHEETDDGKEIKKVVIDKDLLYILNGSNILSCLKIDNDELSSYELLWRKSLNLAPRIMLTTKDGFSCYGSYNKETLSTFDTMGTVANQRTPAEFLSSELFDTLSWLSRRKLRSAKFNTFLKELLEEDKKVFKSTRSGPDSGPRSITHSYLAVGLPVANSELVQVCCGFDTMFCWFDCEGRDEVYALKFSPARGAYFEKIATIPASGASDMKHSMAFDDDLDIGIACTNGSLYAISRQSGGYTFKLIHQRDKVAAPYAIHACGDGHFAAIAISGIKDRITITSSGLPKLNILELSYDENSDSFSQSLKRTSIAIFTEPHRCTVHTALGAIGKRFCFSAGSQVFIWEFGGKQPIQTDLVASTPSDIIMAGDTALVCYMNNGQVYSINVY